ncbi:hypothetical protein, conserved [Trypanosoma brucei gambiense DAL972]|uniref:Sfi1 spindle body domain-containing protein n=1 Tax=Trypanosoma brucei gambiense (strain MHOM/CI/86/DAL972) TaxID=679716 RepID=C9ZMT5_TRYB9|nr:hypothetical protein, conserved [Trypanosoma brucei gambiense DAL972]CBH10588.1 hypothetical protein, conserved [Trypanosoma brucei gambiense DAL972]|eukprot:XP_011772877.1 hypothetical protein, conserved [Trypanosoma brucei gambiense DAL972]
MRITNSFPRTHTLAVSFSSFHVCCTKQNGRVRVTLAVTEKSSVGASRPAWPVVMTESDMYRGSCSVLLQAVLTQACRIILALCATAKGKGTVSERITATVAAYISTVEASSVVEGASKYAMLTAVHMIHCEHHPYRACQHQHGELGAAVGVVLKEAGLRLHILTALTQLIMKRCGSSEGSVGVLLSRAASLESMRHEAASTMPNAEENVSTELLLQVFPELGVAPSKAESGAVVIIHAVHCGCPHQWFSLMLPTFLLAATMEEHVRVWRRTTLLLKAFRRLQQRRGMRLLRAIVEEVNAPSSVAPPMERLQALPDTITCGAGQEGYIETSIVGVSTVMLEDEEVGKKDESRDGIHTGENRSDPPESAVTNSSIVGTCIIRGDSDKPTVSGGVPDPVRHLSSSTREPDSVSSVGHIRDKLVNDFVKKRNTLAAEHLKRFCLSHWRYARMHERCAIKQQLRKLAERTTQECWTHWKSRWQCHREMRRKQDMEKQCDSFVTEKLLKLQKHVFSFWRALFLLRQFQICRLGRRCFVRWRCAYTFIIHSRGDKLPLMLRQDMGSRCFLQWRDAYRQRVADRMCARRYFSLMRERLERWSIWREQEQVAVMRERTAVQRRCLSNWYRAWRVQSLCTRFISSACKRLKCRVMTVWRVRWLRREDTAERLRTLYAWWNRRIAAHSFHWWCKRVRLQRSGRRLSDVRERRFYRFAWARWSSRVLSHQRLTQKHELTASRRRQWGLLRATWCTWHRRYAKRVQQRHARNQEETLKYAAAMREQSLVASAYFTWKRKAHMIRRRLPGKPPAAVGAGGGTSIPLGLNRSFTNRDASLLTNDESCDGEKTGEDCSYANIHRVPTYKTSHTGVFNVSKRCLDHREPPEALRAERLLIRSLDSPRWQAIAHSRLFNIGGNITRSNTKVDKSPVCTQADYRQFQHQKRYYEQARWNRNDELLDVTPTMPSDIENDACPSVEDSQLPD